LRNESPDINDNGHVVWCGAGDIFLYDGTTTTQLTYTDTQYYDNYNPQINNNGYVVWWGVNKGWDYSEREIFLATPVELCNGIDDDSDGSTDEGFTIGTEICGNGDDDCDGEVDEDDVCGDMCEADFDCVARGPGDKKHGVDGADVKLFLKYWGKRIPPFTACTFADPCDGDFDCDGNVDGDDGKKLREDFGRNWFYKPCPACLAIQDPGPWCMY